MKSEEIFVLNLYFQSKGKLNRTDVLSVIKRWFLQFNFEIEQRSGKSGKIVSFSENKLFLNFFAGTDSCAFYAGNSNNETELQMMNWQVFADINFDNEELILSVNENLIEGDKLELIKSFVNQLSVVGDVFYGYSFTEQKVKGIGYAIRLIFYEMDGDFKKHNELAKKVAKWESAVEEKRITEKFRNIFPYNIFSPSYFKFRMSEKTVVEWLKKENFKLIELEEDLVIWVLPEGEIGKVSNEFIAEDKIWEI